ncbi:MAG: lasso peptide biosynthesis PqqD family chaperone [Actinomycetota bacterium]
MAFKLRRKVSIAEVEYGTALLDEERGQYWTLNPTGALILQTLLGGGSLELAAQVLTDEYEVDLETAGEDVQALVDDLSSAGLLER